jgi:hypothetical protein
MSRNIIFVLLYHRHKLVDLMNMKLPTVHALIRITSIPIIHTDIHNDRRTAYQKLHFRNQEAEMPIHQNIEVKTFNEPSIFPHIHAIGKMRIM